MTGVEKLLVAGAVGVGLIALIKLRNNPTAPGFTNGVRTAPVPTTYDQAATFAERYAPIKEYNAVAAKAPNWVKVAYSPFGIALVGKAALSHPVDTAKTIKSDVVQTFAHPENTAKRLYNWL